MKGAEQAEALPAGSVAVAENSEVVVVVDAARRGRVEAESAADPGTRAGRSSRPLLVQRHGG